jgi:lysophospholipase L1-like esterase
MSGRRSRTDKSPPPSELERLVRYCHPAKILGTTRLPGTLSDDALARLYGVPEAGYRAAVSAVVHDALAAARGLRPARVAGPLLALGDSHTDDLASWAEILDAVLDVEVVNAGLSGDTTTAARARVSHLSPAAHAFVLLGTNDARRHGDGGMLVSHGETRRNLRAIDRELRRRCDDVTWITPPPIVERRIRADRALAEAAVAWQLDEVARKAALVREEWPQSIDLWPLFTADHLAADGLHASAEGQRLIAALVLERLRG